MIDVRIKIEGPVLAITLTGVTDTEVDYRRVCNIEMALLKLYCGHSSLPWVWREGEAIVQWVRGDSTHEDYHAARKVLQGFGFCI